MSRASRHRRRVAATGYLDAAEVSAALLACDTVALPFLDGASARRGTLMAAIAHGVPIVTTRPPARAAHGNGAARLVSGLPLAIAESGPASSPGLLRDEDSALLVPPGDDAALAGALARLADDEILRTRLAAGVAALAPRFAWEAIAEEMERVYADVLTGQCAAAPSGVGAP